MGVGGLATCHDCGMMFTRDRAQAKIQDARGSGTAPAAAPGTSRESSRLKKLQAQAEDCPGREDLPEITQKLVAARAAYAATSRLKRAERKDLQREVDALEARRTEIAKAQLDARRVVAEELVETERRLQAVKSELTKAR